MNNPIVMVTGNKTLGEGDDGTLQCVTAAAILTIPKDTTYKFLISDKIFINADTASTVSIAAATGVTLQTLGDGKDISGQNGYITLEKLADDLWTAWGDLA